MSRLLDFLTAQTAEAELAAEKAQEDAAVAIAYGRSEQDNQVIVDTAMASLAADAKDPSPVQTPAFVAALGALPAEQRERALNELQSALNVTSRLAARAGWSTLKRRIKDAARTVDAARAGAQNAEGMAAGTVVDPNDYLAMANAFVAQYVEQGHCKLRRWKGRWFLWSGAVYEEIDDEIVDGLAYQFLASLSVTTSDGPQPLQPHKKLVEYLLHAIAPLVQVPGAAPLRWLDADDVARPAIDRCVFCTNGTLSVDAWISGDQHAFIAPTPALFILRTLGMPFDPAAKAPRFERFISEIFDGDVDRIVAMQILFGYWLIACTILQIIVIFSGLPQTGKGTLLTIIQAILGISCSNPSFEQLGSLFGLEDLVGANLAILSDVHDTGGNAKSAVEKLLKISGEDSVDVPRKHKPALNGLHLPARFILAMNELVSLPDVSGALSRRLVVIPFQHSFMGKGHAGLAKEMIDTEGPGVLLWALVGLRALQHVMADAVAKGQPTKDTVIALLRTKAAEADHELLDDLSNPVRVFIREECCVSPEKSIDMDILYGDWDNWRDRNGHMKRMKSRFIADLLAASRGQVSTGQRSDPDGSRPRIFKGITTQRVVQAEAESEKMKQVDAAKAEAKRTADEVKTKANADAALARFKEMLSTPPKPTTPPATTPTASPGAS